MTSLNELKELHKQLANKVYLRYLVLARQVMARHSIYLYEFCSAMGSATFDTNWGDNLDVSEVMKKLKNVPELEEMEQIELEFGDFGIKGLGCSFKSKGNVVVDWTIPTEKQWYQAFNNVKPIKIKGDYGVIIQSSKWEDYLAQFEK